MKHISCSVYLEITKVDYFQVAAAIALTPKVKIKKIPMLLQSWTLISRHLRNVAEKCFSADVPKVLIFGLLVRTGTINDFSC